MKKCQGVYTALVTPFDAKGQLDEEGLRKNIRHQIACGIDGIVPLGTTGESPTLSSKEKEHIISIAIEEAKGKIAVMVGTGSYSTQQTIENSLLAQKKGADMVLIVTPYYNRPTQEGIFQHFKAVASAITVPIILYNIQGRTGQNIATDTLKRIADLPGIIGIKEASGNMGQISDVIEMVARHHPNFSVMSGDDALTFPIMAMGGLGIISVAANLIPKQVKSLVTAIQKGDYKTARELHFQLMPFFRAAFIETNPIPIKAAMSHYGMPAGSCRLPLCDMSPENLSKLKAVLQQTNWKEK